ncbi:restriction alleviation protein, Lar family [Sinorhizobium medicae]|uniref:Lar family restriction alleviation protein n=1 Tax=Sinorhizobium TaxID=28105 RepID=UPI000FDC9EB9|nr:restriction alleviation protein, Lar family [Sinorhizobium medicae]MQY00431.1 restriction alleviation protein, Lar family [Sinorhizobium medicae]RVI28211.1 restriction alleviation protein, Lar family [Sinorhizobium meliloti]
MARRLPKLRRCPFCGQSDAFVERADFSSSYVFCNNCSAKGPTECQETFYEETPGERAAIQSWNKRIRAIRTEGRGNG